MEYKTCNIYNYIHDESICPGCFKDISKELLKIVNFDIKTNMEHEYDLFIFIPYSFLKVGINNILNDECISVAKFIISSPLIPNFHCVDIENLQIELSRNQFEIFKEFGFIEELSNDLIIDHDTTGSYTILKAKINYDKISNII